MSFFARWACVLGLVGAACDPAPRDPKVELAALADLTTRQLIAGLNADNREVLAGLTVITSTSGGAPRSLSSEEVSRLVFPPGPYEYLGVGRPGSIILLDGQKERRTFRLIRVGDGLKVLASQESAARYLAGGTGQPPVALPAGSDARVVTLFASRAE